MGIKGIYKEIGPGKRISLCKLATEHLEKTGQPFRLAIDISIWQFQIQAARGGSNPAIRTLFYRLARLLGTAIKPIFVFDGPNKPVFKRNKRSGRGDGVSTAMAKRVIGLFGFATHDAPGEAEAECAFLQRHDIVDAVLSEDVDTIMFGCGKTLRNWSSEGSKGSKTPTHVTVYDTKKLAADTSGLDREGMVLVALMSGGDYLPEGVPGCGIKVACEAARAGFGRELCKIKLSDAQALASWKEKLLRELRTNESRFFRTKHKALEIPEGFPNLEVLRYYTHPVVSKQENLDKIRQKFLKSKEVNVVGLRVFVAETFDWTYKIGAIKFIRVVCASLLVQRLVRGVGRTEDESDAAELKQKQAASFVKSVTKRREHFSTDSTPELRISYVPADVVGLDLSEEQEVEPEEYGRQGLSLNSDDEFGDEADDGENGKGASAAKLFDPSKPSAIWVPEYILRISVPLIVSEWEENQRAKGAKTKKNVPARPKKTDKQAGAMDKFVKVTKAVGTSKSNAVNELPQTSQFPLESPAPSTSTRPTISNQKSLLTSPARPAPKASASKRQPSGKGKEVTAAKAQATKPSSQINPWTIAASKASSGTSRFTSSFNANNSQDPILISSSPVGSGPVSPTQEALSQTTPTRRGKRLSSLSFKSINEPPSPDLPPLLEATGKQPVKGNALPAPPPPEQVWRTRPFKRTKSGAEGVPKDDVIEAPVYKSNTSDPVTSGTKTNLKADLLVISKAPAHMSSKRVGGVTRNDAVASASFSAEQVDSATTISFFSSDEEPEIPLPPAPQDPPCTRGIRKPSLPVDKPQPRDGYLDENDLFGPEDSFQSPIPSVPSSLRSKGISPLRKALTGDASQRGSKIVKEGKPKVAVSGTTKLFIPRKSGVGAGFFSEIEVTREEADKIISEQNSTAPKGLLGPRTRGKIFRRSDISIVDLTGED